MSDKTRSDIMVDLETYDTTPTSVILSIGACKVDLDAGTISDMFYRVVSIESNEILGRTTSASTKAFWDRQPEEARSIFYAPNVPLREALQDFRTYVKLLGPHRDTYVWGNGSDFDNVILTNAYKAIDVPLPWPFYNNRCFRTIRKEFGGSVSEPIREGTHHNALDDAVFQAKVLAKLYQERNAPVWPV